MMGNANTTVCVTDQELKVLANSTAMSRYQSLFGVSRLAAVESSLRAESYQGHSGVGLARFSRAHNNKDNFPKQGSELGCMVWWDA